MRGLRRWAGYPALNRPLTILGVERRGFLLSRDARARDVERDGIARDGRRGLRRGLRCRVARWPEGPRHAWRAPSGDAFSGAVRPGQVGAGAVASPDTERAVRVAAELRDHDAAGSLAEELPYWGWLEDGRTCLTRSGELITAGRLEPAVVDGRSPEQIDRVLGRWQRLLSGLDAHTRLYFYLLRRPSVPEGEDADGSGIVAVSRRKRGAFLSGRVQQLEAYLVWSFDPRLRTVADGPASGRASRLTQWWQRRRADAPTYLGTEIEAAAARFRALVDAGRALVSEHTPIDILPAAEASRLLSELINRPGTVWDGATGSGMNWRLALSELEAERSHLRLDGEPVILYSLLSPPGQAYANLLRELYCLDAVITVSLEWRPWSMEAARRRIRGAQRHYFAKRYSMMAHVQETEGTAAAMVDSAAAAESDRLGEALVELEADGVSYGEASFTVALHGELGRIERLNGDLRRLFAAHDAKVIREAYGQLPAWFSRLPAQPRGRQVRKVFVSAGVAACLAPLFGPPRGRVKSKHLGREALAVLETPWRTAYHYDLFSGDVGHTLMLGATGSGKSFTLNFLLVEALKYDPRVLILDLGGSYRWLTRFVGGRYLELSPGEAEPTLRLQPFALPATTRSFQFLTGWVLRLLKLGGWEATGADTSEIRARIEDLYAFEPERRTLGVLAASLPSGMWPAWSRWISTGAWGAYFDNPARRGAGPRVRRLAGDRPGGRGRASGPLRRGSLLPARAHAPRGGGSVRDGAAQADGRGRGLALPAGPGGAELPGRGGEDVAEEERRARPRHAVGGRRDGHAGRVDAPRVDPHEALPREPRASRRGRGAVPAEQLGTGPDPGPDPQTGTLPPQT